jgi:oligosaccharide translocation protein RFT1
LKFSQFELENIYFSGARLLRVYCFYILLLALNGISECFMFATFQTREVRRHERFLAALAIVYVLMQLAFSYAFGAVGFVLTNCVNMMARIAYRCAKILASFTL